ncbi:MAG TPA: hypothetical protein VF235_03440, partial [Actinomycetota bacterium]
PVRRSNRGFWLVAGTMLVASVFLLVEIFVNFDTKDTIAHTQDSLRRAAALAEDVRADGFSFDGADAAGLADAAPSSRLVFLDGDTPSAGLDEVSVAAEGDEWGATVRARPGACFYLHLTGDGQTLYGVGTDCRGTAALEATDDRW